MEATLVLFDDSDNIKPGLTFFAEFAHNLSSMTSHPALPEDDPEAIGLYVPLHYYTNGDSDNPGNTPSDQSGNAKAAYTMLRILDYQTRVVRGDLTLPSPEQLQVLLVTSSVLTASEILAFESFVKAGGILVLHGLASSYFDGASKDVMERLLGACSESSLPGKLHAKVDFGGSEWQFAPDEFLHGASHSAPVLSNFSASVAEVWSDKATGLPLLVLTKHAGGGAVFASVPAVEVAVWNVMREPILRDAWNAWYSGVLNCLHGHCSSAGLSGSSSAEPKQEQVSRVHIIPSNRSSVNTLAKASHAMRNRRVLVFGAASLAAVAVKGLSSLGLNAVNTSVLTAASLGHVDLLFVIGSMPMTNFSYASHWLSSYTQRCMIWSGVDYGSLSRSMYTAAGVAAVDFRHVGFSNFSTLGRAFTFELNEDKFLEFSVQRPVQRPEWGHAEVIAVDQAGLEVLHRHVPSKSGGTFVLSSVSAEKWHPISSTIEDWYSELISLCSSDGELPVSIQI
eukprot:TRINITY_DN10766_c0_g1_i1.p1 TRINITY_DN10766_c0_g1~~TRINITY_DN10766_c0_g1_i1.p1  ORF type:complete len:508 (-),score=63.99 TRINITY_DN10766_c0_g1_i1:187-1710(-)